MASPGTPLLGYLGVGEGLAEPVGAWGTSALVKRGGRGGRTGGEGWVAWGIEKVWAELPVRSRCHGRSESRSLMEPAETECSGFLRRHASTLWKLEVIGGVTSTKVTATT